MIRVWNFWPHSYLQGEDRDRRLRSITRGRCLHQSCYPADCIRIANRAWRARRLVDASRRQEGGEPRRPWVSTPPLL